MRKEYFVYMHNKNVYLLSLREDNLPPNKIAARVSLSSDQIKHLSDLSWTKYQEMLEYYFEHGQKLVTA